jgi:hypothetical protein
MQLVCVQRRSRGGSSCWYVKVTPHHKSTAILLAFAELVNSNRIGQLSGSTHILALQDAVKKLSKQTQQYVGYFVISNQSKRHLPVSGSCSPGAGGPAAGASDRTLIALDCRQIISQCNHQHMVIIISVRSIQVMPVTVISSAKSAGTFNVFSR